MRSIRTRRIELSTSKETFGFESNLLPEGFSDTATSTLYTTQTTESEGHPFSRLGKSDMDIGGEFFSKRSWHIHNCPYLEIWSGAPHNSSFYRGRIFPRNFATPQLWTNDFADLMPTERTVLDALGTTAIAQTIPTNPVASLATFIGELREGFPRIIGSTVFKSRLRNLRKGVGREYLNWEFGWKPLIADVQRFIHAARNADKLWAQFLRDSGRRVRRRYTFPRVETVQSSTSDEPIVMFGMIGNDGFWQGGNNIFPRFYESREITDRWFSGAFTYYADHDPAVMNSWKGHLQRFNKLYGVKLTPDVLWNLSPWSWAADWFSNTGDVVHNITQFSDDGLVMPYGYMMEHKSRQDTYRMRDVTPKGYNIPDLTEVFRTTVKYRIQATPYGFGLDLGDLSPRQLAIIAALGLSRGK